MGSSTFGLPALTLLHQNHQVVCVYTRPEKPSGRGLQEHKTPIHEFALAQGIPVKTPQTLRTEAAAAELSAFNPDVVVVAAYGLILPQAILDVSKQGCINIHGSLLPRWRGAAPIHRALLNGDEEIGVTIMKMDAGLDTGPILKKGVLKQISDSPEFSDCRPAKQGVQALNVRGPEERNWTPVLTDSKGFAQESVAPGESVPTFQTIHDALADLGAALLIDVLDHLNTIIPQDQDESLATYAPKVTKEDAVIDSTMSVEKVLNVIRTFGGGWGARFDYKGDLLAVHTARSVDDGLRCCPLPTPPLTTDTKRRLFFSCANGLIEICTIQRKGKKIISTKEFLNGFMI